MSDRFDEDYYMRGKELGISGYENYRWLPDLTLPMARRIVEHVGIAKEDTVLDFGCARGYLVKALRMLGYDARGEDVSKWAIENCDPEVKEYLTCGEGKEQFDWIIAKDVLEHIPMVDLTIYGLIERTCKGIFVVVPLSDYYGGPYVIPDYDKDVTHVQRHTLIQWAEKFIRPGWSVEVSYRVPGVKDNWHRPGWERGNGFIVARRIMG